jgi:hypothetical protein
MRRRAFCGSLATNHSHTPHGTETSRTAPTHHPSTHSNMAMTQRSTLNPLRDQFSSLFSDLENALMSGGMTMGTTPGGMRGRTTTGYAGGVLSCDVCEADDKFMCYCDFPGVPKDQASVLTFLCSGERVDESTRT